MFYLFIQFLFFLGGGGVGGRLFEAGRLLTFLATGWALIRGGRLFEVGCLNK